MQLPLPVPPGSRPLPDAYCGLQGAIASAPTPHNWATWRFAHAKTMHGIRMVDVQRFVSKDVHCAILAKWPKDDPCFSQMVMSFELAMGQNTITTT